MKINFVAVVLGAILCLPLTVASGHQADLLAQLPPRVVPLTPAQLLPLMPVVPAGWKVTSSVATNQMGTWLATIGMKDAERTAPATPAAPGQPPSLPVTMQVTFTLIDTGFDPTFLNDFQGFKVGIFGKQENLIINSSPAVLLHDSATSETLSMWIHRRFVLKITTTQQPPNSTKAWAQQIDLIKLGAVPNTGSRELPRPIVISFVDELNPKANNTFSTGSAVNQ